METSSFPIYAMKQGKKAEVKLNTVLTSAPGECQWSPAIFSGRYTPADDRRWPKE
jgi:hypothetical protein